MLEVLIPSNPVAVSSVLATRKKYRAAAAWPYIIAFGPTAQTVQYDH